MTTFQDYCAALDKLNAAIREVKEYLAKHPASQLGEITLELPKDYAERENDLRFSFWNAGNPDDDEFFSVDLWRLRYDYLHSEKSKDLILEYWTQDAAGGWYWEDPTAIENRRADERVALAPYLPLLIKRADEILELQTGQLEQNVQGIYEALEAAKKNGLPTDKPGKKRK